jgi:DNA-binding transcriptional ArsR family regulator
MLQIEKIVNYHKALADPTRIRILILLSKGELSGQVLAEKLQLSPPTVTHHAMKLREAALLHERREKNTIFFSLNEYFLRQNAQSIVELIFNHKPALEEEHDLEKNQKLKLSVLTNFFTKEGKLKHPPAQFKKKLIAIEHIVSGLEMGKKYTENEINTYIKEFHDDYATIRREFIMYQYMYRENEIYEMNPKELWTKWEEVQ